MFITAVCILFLLIAKPSRANARARSSILIEPCPSFFMAMASGMFRGRVRPYKDSQGQLVRSVRAQHPGFKRKKGNGLGQNALRV